MIQNARVEFKVGKRTWAAIFNKKNRACGVIQNIGRLKDEHYADGSQQWMCLLNATPSEVIEFLKEKEIDTTQLEPIAALFENAPKDEAYDPNTELGKDMLTGEYGAPCDPKRFGE